MGRKAEKLLSEVNAEWRAVVSRAVKDAAESLSSTADASLVREAALQAVTRLFSSTETVGIFTDAVRLRIQNELYRNQAWAKSTQRRQTIYEGLQSITQENPPEHPDYDKNISYLKLSPAIKTALLYEGINTIRQLTTRTLQNIQDIRDIGEVRSVAIRKELQRIGLSLRDEFADQKVAQWFQERVGDLSE